MNKIKMLIATLILGTSAAAFAAPTAVVITQQPGTAPTATVVANAQPQWQQPAPQVQWQQPAPQPQQWQQPQRGHRASWSTLVGSAKINGTREYIRLGAQAGRFDELKLQMVSGKTQINTVQINFANGGSQTVRLNTTLDRNNPSALIQLSGKDRAIANITVYGSSGARSAYEILGLS